MTTTASRTTTIDQFSALPASSRRGGGRAHEVYWTASKPSPITDPAATSFSFGSYDPGPIVNFGRKRLTFSFLSARTGTVQQGESPWEFLLAKHLETLPSVGAYRLHGHRAVLVGPDGETSSYGPDAVWTGIDGTVTCAEVKASAGYFAEPATAALLDVAERGLAAGGIRFARITSDALREDRRREFNVCRAFADGRGRIGEAVPDRARDALAGGPLALGALGERLGIDASSRVRIVNALMVRRIAAYDLSDAVTPDLCVTAAPLAKPAPDLAALTI
ncbi:hypothetical protein VH567_11135 [Sphingomonas sp. 4RDLI-65]|uniref:hypothetical protein n=1 Tax=Sphingomonas sp. 4RDLI-65 TaxID=3111641 RepID=UPI003C2583E3